MLKHPDGGQSLNLSLDPRTEPHAPELRAAGASLPGEAGHSALPFGVSTAITDMIATQFSPNYSKNELPPLGDKTHN